MATNPIRHKRDQLKQFRAFCAAARFENMTKAADRLAVTQRAVALQVRSLEYELETELFERNGPRLALTQAGKRFYELAWPLVEEMDSLAEAFAEKRSELTSANIEVAIAPLALLLSVFVKQFLDKHPRVRIRLTNCSVQDGLRHLANGRVDLVIGPYVAGTDFVYTPLSPIELMFVMSEDHPLAELQRVRVEDARPYPAVVPAVGTYGSRFEDTVANRLSVAARVAVELNGWGVLKVFVRAGNGISVMPGFCISARDGLHAVKVDGYLNGNDCGAYTRQLDSVAPPVIDFLRNLEVPLDAD